MTDKTIGPFNELALIRPQWLGIEIADASDEKQLRALAEKAFVVITTVGPYCLYGEPVLKACVETGTHYLDCTGEVPWVARMVKKYEALARKSGAMIFPQCGFESAPPDLLTWSMTQYLQKQMSAQAKEVYVTIHKIMYVSLLHHCCEAPLTKD